MCIVESNGVDFAVYQMTSSAKRWWRDYVRGTPAGSPPLTWDQFSQLFLEKFVHVILREGYRNQFEHLQQGSMTVTQYETRYFDLFVHAIILIPTEMERVRIFIDGLTYDIRLQMARETKDDISFNRVVEIDRRFERVYGRA
ncbi:uncharacterized protein [Nicotiana tomentosiformis]|uniref:uncharacterized protein n=1 Tax=Nicotiana tomentosiformis TaxID=4098 RepID=UPI00388C3BC2